MLHSALLRQPLVHEPRLNDKVFIQSIHIVKGGCPNACRWVMVFLTHIAFELPIVVPIVFVKVKERDGESMLLCLRDRFIYAQAAGGHSIYGSFTCRSSPSV